MKNIKFLLSALIVSFMLPSISLAVVENGLVEDSVVIESKFPKLIGKNNIQDNAITSKKIKDGTIGWNDLSPTLVNYLKIRAQKGERGEMGPAGPIGPAKPYRIQDHCFKGDYYYRHYTVSSIILGGILCKKRCQHTVWVDLGCTEYIKKPSGEGGLDK